MPASPKIRSTSRIGHYALGVDWEGGHESIMPFTHIRAHCPCEDCAKLREAGGLPGGAGTQLRDVEMLGERSIFFAWTNGHESVFLLAELRALCRCAYCIGEPERPITGAPSDRSDRS